MTADPLSALDGIDPSARDLTPRPNTAALEFLLTRRSVPAKMLDAPGPDDAALTRILTAATRVPDHKKLTPWRFILVGDATRAAMIEAMATRGAELGLDAAQIEKAQTAMRQGPCIIASVFSPKPEPSLPEVEQLLSAGAATAALVNAALASGFGANWLSGWHAHDAVLPAQVLGLAPEEQIVGFVHIGTARQAPPERPRPALEDLVTWLD